MTEHAQSSPKAVRSCPLRNLHQRRDISLNKEIGGYDQEEKSSKGKIWGREEKPDADPTQSDLIRAWRWPVLMQPNLPLLSFRLAIKTVKNPLALTMRGAHHKLFIKTMRSRLMCFKVLPSRPSQEAVLLHL